MSEEATDVALAHGIDVDALHAAPFVAVEYHGGQWSAMYALASSGRAVLGLAREARRAAVLADEQGDVEGWEALTAVAAFADAIDDGEGE